MCRSGTRETAIGIIVRFSQHVSLLEHCMSRPQAIDALAHIGDLGSFKSLHSHRDTSVSFLPRFREWDGKQPAIGQGAALL